MPGKAWKDEGNHREAAQHEEGSSHPLKNGGGHGRGQGTQAGNLRGADPHIPLPELLSLSQVLW